MVEGIIVLGSLIVGLIVAFVGIARRGLPPPDMPPPSTGPFSMRWLTKITLGGIAPWTGIGPAGWDFSKSWATNITVLAAVFTAFLGSKIVASPTFVPDTGYALLSVLFAALVAVAPLAFRTLSTEKTVLTPAGTNDIQFQGNAGGFLLAVLLTLWGSLGQLATLATLTTEVLLAKVPQHAASIPLLLVLAITGIGTIWYVRSTIKPLLAFQSNIGGHANSLVTAMQQQGVSPPPDFGPSDAPLPGWRAL
jgi:hypothetical protein